MERGGAVGVLPWEDPGCTWLLRPAHAAAAGSGCGQRWGEAAACWWRKEIRLIRVLGFSLRWDYIIGWVIG